MKEGKRSRLCFSIRWVYERKRIWFMKEQCIPICIRDLSVAFMKCHDMLTIDCMNDSLEEVSSALVESMLRRLKSLLTILCGCFWRRTKSIIDRNNSICDWIRRWIKRVSSLTECNPDDCKVKTFWVRFFNAMKTATADSMCMYCQMIIKLIW